MDLKELVKYVNYDQITLSEVLIRLFISGISGFLIATIYRLYHGKDKSHVDMMHALIFISLIICSALMIIGNNLASAFGLVGAVSIIRFRTSVKSARDMSFVFFAVVIGMSCGLGYLLLAILGLIFIGIVMIAVYFIQINKQEEYLDLYNIKINYRGIPSERETIENILNSHCEIVDLDSLKIDNEKISYIYRVSIETIDVLEKILSSLNNNKLTKLKIMFTKLEKK